MTVMIETMRRRLCAGAAVLCIAAGAASAQTATDDGPLPADGVAAPQDAETAMADIVVTGSRIARSGFTAPTPVTVLGSDRIEKLGLTNVADALNQLPSFRASSTPSTNGLSLSNIGARLADLRGLGATRTLVLVDGRRFVPTTTQGTVDLNLIPTSLIERSEVVTGGASAAYGSDAVAGVVNLILNKRLTGLRAQVQYGTTEVGDNESYQASLAGGTGFAGGRGHLIAGVEYEKSLGAGNCYSRKWCRPEWLVVTNPTPGANGLPQNVIASNVHTSTMTPGGLITGGPGLAQTLLRGTQFTADGTPAPFTYGQLVGAIYMIGGTGKGENAFLSGIRLAVPVERYNGYAHVDYDLGGDINGFLEGSFGRTIGKNPGGGSTRDLGNIVIRQDNAYLPEQIRQIMIDNAIPTFNLGRAGTDFGEARGVTTNETYRIVAGLDGSLGGSWKWNGYYQYGHNSYRQRTYNNRITARFQPAVDAVRAPDGSIVCRSTLTDPGNGCVPVDLFGTFQWTPEAKAYLYGSSRQDIAFTQHVASLGLQGDLFSTWAGPVSVALGGEYRSDKAVGTTDPISAASGFYVGNATAVNGRIAVTEGFAETIVPLARDTAWARNLEFNGAVRRTHYNTSGSVTTWKVGGVYEPTGWLRLRVTQSRDIRAPNISELFGSRTTGFGTITNPSTRVQTLSSVSSGGNPGLKPERADTFTAGFAFTPRGAWLTGFRLSVDYYDIKLDDAIASFGAQNIVNRCFAGAQDFCALVTRDDAGGVTAVDNFLLNLNRLKTRGIDIEADYRLPLSRVAATLPGELNIRLLGTHVTDLATVDPFGTIDRAGQTGSPISNTVGVPKWTIDGIVTYTGHGFSLTAQGHYVGSGTYDVTNIGPDDPAYTPTVANGINNNKVPSRLYVNLSGSIDLVRSGDRLLQLYGAVSNLFDKGPPVSPPRTNMALFDPLGRAYRVGLRVRY